MNKQREALIVAARFVDGFIKSSPLSQMDIGTSQVLRVIQEALAEPEQEPVAWVYQNANTDDEYLVWKRGNGGRNWRPLYTAPPTRKPLTDEQISRIWDSHVVPVFGKNGINPIVFARAIERAHGITE